MGLLTKQALDFFVHKISECRSCCKNFMKSNGYMAAKQEQERHQGRKHESISSYTIVAQVSIKPTSKSLKMPPELTEVGDANDIQTPSLPFEDQINQQRFSEETQQDLINRTFCPRCNGSGSESRLQTWFDTDQERKMHHKITARQVNLNMNNDDTRLINGLLTTTLCSTEL